MTDTDTRSRRRRLIAILVALGGLVVAVTLLVRSGVTLADMRALAVLTADWAERQPALVFAALVVAQAAGMALSLPTKALLTLLAGALLGAVWGTVATMIGVLAGTSVLFVAARWGLRERFLAVAGDRARRLERRIARRPVRAMAGLRLVVTLPYGPITIAAALTTIPYVPFLVGSFLGDLPVVALYAVAGRELMQLESVGDVLSPTTLVILLAAAAVFLATTFLGGRGDPLAASPEAASPDALPPADEGRPRDA